MSTICSKFSCEYIEKLFIFAQKQHSREIQIALCLENKQKSFSWECYEKVLSCIHSTKNIVE